MNDRDEDLEIKTLREQNQRLRVEVEHARSALRGIRAELNALSHYVEEISPGEYSRFRCELLKLTGE